MPEIVGRVVDDLQIALQPYGTVGGGLGVGGSRLGGELHAGRQTPQSPRRQLVNREADSHQAANEFTATAHHDRQPKRAKNDRCPSSRFRGQAEHEVAVQTVVATLGGETQIKIDAQGGVRRQCAQVDDMVVEERLCRREAAVGAVERKDPVGNAGYADGEDQRFDEAVAPAPLPP